MAERASSGSLVLAEITSVSTPRLAKAFTFRTISAGSVPSAYRRDVDTARDKAMETGT